MSNKNSEDADCQESISEEFYRFEDASFVPNEIMHALSLPTFPKQNLAPIKSDEKLWQWNTTSKVVKDDTECHKSGDISYLYNLRSARKKVLSVDKSDRSAKRHELIVKDEGQVKLPLTIIPEEHHIKRDQQLLGVEVYGPDAEEQLSIFPSLNPDKRDEVLHLKQTLNKLLSECQKKIDECYIFNPEEVDELLNLINKEKNINNIIFHELSRQCTNDCFERGRLLDNIRNKYNCLLNKIPPQICGLYKEVLAQRDLDKRITDELLHFKNAIEVLTRDLMAIKEHDTKVSNEAEIAKKKLRDALDDAAKNASLLQDFHNLYELHRQRIEKNIDVLTQERENWSSVVYSLAIKVVEESQLATARKLYITEKSWLKLANHFTLLLSNKDTESLSDINTNVMKFQDLLWDLNLNLVKYESFMKERIEFIVAGVESWVSYSKTYITSEESFIPPFEKQASMLKQLQSWQTAVQSFMDAPENTVNEILTFTHKWTMLAQKVFNRHRKEEKQLKEYEENELPEINKEINDLCENFLVRLSGTNGLDELSVSILKAFEIWEKKLHLSVTGNSSIPADHWSFLESMLSQWLTILNKLKFSIGKPSTDDTVEKSKLKTPYEIVKHIQLWISQLTKKCDDENSKLIEKGLSLHLCMVRWMIDTLLNLMPANPNSSSNSLHMSPERIPPSVLLNKATEIIDGLKVFSQYVFMCCNEIVQDNVKDRKDRGEVNPELEMHDLHQLLRDCKEWTYFARVLTSELNGESAAVITPLLSSEEVSQATLGITLTDENINLKYQLLPLKSDTFNKDAVEINQTKSLFEQKENLSIDFLKNTYQPLSIYSAMKMFYDGKSPDDFKKPQTPDTQKAFEILSIMKVLEAQLLEAENRAFKAEERITAAKSLIVKYQEEIRVVKTIAAQSKEIKVQDDDSSVPTLLHLASTAFLKTQRLPDIPKKVAHVPQTVTKEEVAVTKKEEKPTPRPPVTPKPTKKSAKSKSKSPIPT